MSFEEKSTWVSAVVTVLVAAGYAIHVLGLLGAFPVAAIPYQWPLIIAIGAMVAMTILGTILMSIGTAVSAEISGEGPVKDMDRKDERDEGIGRRGELVAYYVLSAGVLGALALAMLRYDQFWIANAIFLACVCGGLSSAVAKLVAYRRGF